MDDLNISYKEIQATKYYKKAEEILKLLPAYCDSYYMSIKHSKAASTICLYMRDIYKFYCYILDNNPLFNGKTVKDISISDLNNLTRQDVEEFLNNLYNTNVTGYEVSQRNSTKRIFISALTSFFTYYEDEGVLDKNIMLKVSKAKKERKRRVIRLDNEEEEAFLSAVKFGTGLTKKQAEAAKKTRDRDYAIALILLRTGLRVSEVVGLNIEDISFKRHSFLVARKESLLKDDEVFFDDDVEDALKLYLNGKNAANCERGTPVFTVSQGKYKGNRLSVRSIENMVYKFSAAGTGRRISPHKLRATYATNMINETGNIELVKSLLGHADITTTTLYIDEESLKKEKARNVLKARSSASKDTAKAVKEVEKKEF